LNSSLSIAKLRSLRDKSDCLTASGNRAAAYRIFSKMIECVDRATIARLKGHEQIAAAVEIAAYMASDASVGVSAKLCASLARRGSAEGDLAAALRVALMIAKVEPFGGAGDKAAVSLLNSVLRALTKPRIARPDTTARRAPHASLRRPALDARAGPHARLAITAGPSTRS